MSPIKNIRVNLFKLTQPEFARVIGVDQGTVSRWERGMDPTLGQALKIKEAALARGLEWDSDLLFQVAPDNQAAE
ncbi:helix-turn-helix domain-containing protein [uncultured Alsobacter sp.]|uniref:helix-turn-helix transcriptional regulator n=1 Tax=uncultured Alsobacter sp. TaxID=1748258 RepID=UPI0025D79A9A|nr:helix-turn-helix domain-containing protein [uncultured Alsobacter sp.]